MKSGITVAVLALGVFALLSAPSASAGIVTYSDRPSFEAAGPFSTETFVGLSSISPIPHSVETAVGFSGVMSVYYETAGGVNETSNRLNVSSFLGTGTELVLQWDTTSTDATTVLEIRFSTPISGFGATWGDETGFIGGFDEGNSLRLTTNTGEVFDLGQTPGSFFAGFRADAPFSTLSLTGIGGASSGFVSPVLDDVVIAQAVPEPSSLLLLGAGGLVLAWTARRRRHSARCR